MLNKIDHKTMGKNNTNWLKAIFHFSFGDYYNPHNINFGVLRVLNDDIIEANTGFDMHPHENMEIITYVVNGELTHEDNMGNKSTVSRGNIQYMSAGTGVFHSEHNLTDKALRSLQIWILPNKKGHTPDYGDYEFDWNLRKNKWLNIVSSKEGNAPVKINQDANFYVLDLDERENISFPVNENRQAYLVQIEGKSTINDVQLDTRDALEIVEEDISITANENSHFIVIEMGKE